MKVIIWETLYYEDHGATLKHKCGKRIVTLSLLSFSLIFWAFSFLWPFPFLYLTWDNALIMMIITLLFTYNSRITTQYLEQNMTLCECLQRVYRHMQWIKSDMYERIMIGGFATNTTSTTCSCKAIWQWWCVSYKRTVEAAWQYISEWLWKCHNR